MDLTKKEKARIARFRRKLADAPHQDVQLWVSNTTYVNINPLTHTFKEAVAAQKRADEVYWTHMAPLAQAELDRRGGH